MIVKTAADAYAKSEEKTFGSDRQQTVGASEVGACARMIFWRKNAGDAHFGADEDEDFEDGWGHKMRGNVYENEFWYIAMRRAYKDRFNFGGPQQRTFRDGYLTATPDGVLSDLTSSELAMLGVHADYKGSISIDCKSIDPRVVLHEPKENHVFQLQVQMGTLQANKIDAQWALISYTNASDWSDIKEFVVKFDPAVYQVAKDRAQKIMTALGPEELQPEGIMAGGKECRYCPYTAACAKLRNDRVPEREYKGVVLPDSEETLLRAYAGNIARLKSEVEQREKRLGEEIEQLKAELARLNVRNFKQGNVSISWSKVAGRRGFDNRAIRERLTELIGEQSMGAFQLQGEASDRLVVTVKE